MYKAECASRVRADFWYVVGENGNSICECRSYYAAKKIVNALNNQEKYRREILMKGYRS